MKLGENFFNWFRLEGITRFSCKLGEYLPIIGEGGGDGEAGSRRRRTTTLRFLPTHTKSRPQQHQVTILVIHFQSIRIALGVRRTNTLDSVVCIIQVTHLERGSILIMCWVCRCVLIGMQKQGHHSGRQKAIRKQNGRKDSVECSSGCCSCWSIKM